MPVTDSGTRGQKDGPDTLKRLAPTCLFAAPTAGCRLKASTGLEEETGMRRDDMDRSYLVKDEAISAVGDTRAIRRRPPCRNFGGDARSRELTDRITQTARRIAGEQRELLHAIAELDRSEAWRGDGAISMTAWVTSHCRVSTSTARQWVTAAAHLESLPCLGEGLASGELSLDLVSSLVEAATSETDAELRQASAQWSVRQARELAAWHRAQQAASAPPAVRNGRKPEAPPMPDHEQGEGTSPVPGTAAREFERRTLRFNDTRRTVWVAFTKDDYSIFKSAMVNRAAAEKREADAADREAREYHEYVHYDQRLYDALMHVIDRSARFDNGADPRAAATGADPNPLSETGADGSQRGSSPTGRTRPRLIIHAPLELLVGLAPATEVGVAEIAGLGPVETEVVRRLACDAKVELSVESREGRILDQGRVRRDPTTAQRLEIARRDKGCRFPGCLFSEFTDVHHIRHWVSGGETNFDNLVTLCDRHHKAVHELGWSVVGDPNSVLSFTSPNGHVMKSVPSPTWRWSKSSSQTRSKQQVGQARRE